ncbi:MAG TPA: sugar ABC transporter ATP-binding protein [Haliangiales bacterium]|nr:sugar ABC transporter ATP-binding protein [Haliangiales bacterium]
MALLEVHGLEKRFGATVALDGVDLEVAAGEVHALIGENGAGKSTLFNILSGAIAPDAGGLAIAGAPYAPRAPGDARARGIAHIHQELSLCPSLSVAENILLGAEPARLGWIDRDRLVARAAALLGEFGREEIDPRVRAGDLALADRQVVEICRALAWDARIILMDEPTSSLQRANVERLFRLVRALRDRGLAVVYVSHFLEEVREVGDRYTVLRDGRSVRSGELAAAGDDELIAAMVGRAVEPAARGARPAAGDVLLEVRDLAEPPRLRGASFELRRGQVLGLAGLVGSGRTDLLRVLFGLLPAAAGTVRMHGRGMGFLSEDRKGEGLALGLSIADNTTLSRLDTCARAGWIDLRQQRAQAEEVMGRLRVRAAGADVTVRRLSGGNQQKVAFGRLLHQDPDVLLLDEPARGIDIASKADIHREIARLAAAGKGVLLVSSYLPELFAVCDDIAVMSRGRLGPARPAGAWTPDSILAAAIGGAGG